jgi:hypothetical protein
MLIRLEGALELLAADVGVKKEARLLFLLFNPLFNGSKLFINLEFPFALIYFTTVYFIT